MEAVSVRNKAAGKRAIGFKKFSNRYSQNTYKISTYSFALPISIRLDNVIAPTNVERTIAGVPINLRRSAYISAAMAYATPKTFAS